MLQKVSGRTRSLEETLLRRRLRLIKRQLLRDSYLMDILTHSPKLGPVHILHLGRRHLIATRRHRPHQVNQLLVLPSLRSSAAV